MTPKDHLTDDYTDPFFGSLVPPEKENTFAESEHDRVAWTSLALIQFARWFCIACGDTVGHYIPVQVNREQDGGVTMTFRRVGGGARLGMMDITVGADGTICSIGQRSV